MADSLTFGLDSAPDGLAFVASLDDGEVAFRGASGTGVYVSDGTSQRTVADGGG